MLPRSTGPFLNSRENTTSWPQRVHENFLGTFRVVRPSASSANGAPLHFETIDLSARTGKAQTLSMLTHAAILALLFLALVSSPKHTPIFSGVPIDRVAPLPYAFPLHPQSAGEPSPGRNSGGGEQDHRPVRSGMFAPASSMPIVPPRKTDDKNHALPEPPAVFDPNVPANVATIARLGLPPSTSESDSPGPGKDHGFGSGHRGGMGDGDGNNAGVGEGDSPYANVASQVTCLYCPDPGYTEEARKAKLQGKMLIRVLVGADGSAKGIQILEGLGMGLDELAIETIYTWRFSPARDAAHHPISSWVMIETRFQLF